MTIVFPNSIWVPDNLQRRLRKPAKQPDLELVQIGKDIWFTDEPVKFHKDSTKQDCITYGVILVNDSGYLLMYDGDAYDIPSGTIYRIDARRLHGTMGYNRGYGRFAFLAWDMPSDYSLLQFRKEAALEIDQKSINGIL